MIVSSCRYLIVPLPSAAAGASPEGGLQPAAPCGGLYHTEHVGLVLGSDNDSAPAMEEGVSFIRRIKTTFSRRSRCLLYLSDPNLRSLACIIAMTVGLI